MTLDRFLLCFKIINANYSIQFLVDLRLEMSFTLVPHTITCIPDFFIRFVNCKIIL